MPLDARAASLSSLRMRFRQADHSFPLAASLIAFRLRRRALSLAFAALFLCAVGQGEIATAELLRR